MKGGGIRLASRLFQAEYLYSRQDAKHAKECNLTADGIGKIATITSLTGRKASHLLNPGEDLIKSIPWRAWRLGERKPLFSPNSAVNSFDARSGGPAAMLAYQQDSPVG